MEHTNTLWFSIYIL